MGFGEDTEIQLRKLQKILWRIQRVMLGFGKEFGEGIKCCFDDGFGTCESVHMKDPSLKPLEK